MENKMFCFQCQETAKGTGCTVKGVCGKEASTSNYQDLLLGVVRGVATIDRAIRKAGVESVAGVDTYFVDALFACITNANFDDASILKRVDKGIALKKQLLAIAKEHNVELPAYHEILWGGEKADYEAQSRKESVLRNENEDLRSLKNSPFWASRVWPLTTSTLRDWVIPTQPLPTLWAMHWPS